MKHETRGWSRVWWRGIGVGLLCLVAQSALAADGDDVRSGEYARSLLGRWLYESGGSKKIRDVPAIEVVGSVTSGETTLPVVQIATRDGRFMQEYSYPNGMFVREVVTPDRAWYFHSFLGVGVMPPEDASERLRWLSPWLPVDWADWYPSTRKLKDQEFEGRFSNVAEMELPTGVTEKWYLDFSDGLLHTIVRPAFELRPGAAIRFDARRKVGGFSIPSRYTLYDASGMLKVDREEINELEAVPEQEFTVDEQKWQDAETMAKVLERFHQVIGGDTMLAQVRSRVTRSRLEVLSSGVTARVISYRKFPNLALDVKHVEGIGTTWSGFDGKQGWEFSEITGFRLLEGAELQQSRSDADFLSVARMRYQFRLTQNYRREESADGVHHVARLSSFALPGGEYSFSEETGLLDKVVSGVVGPGGGALQVEVLLSDYREYDGVWLPARVRTINPAIETVMEIDSVQHNVELPDELFAPRPEGEDPLPEFSQWEAENAP